MARFRRSDMAIWPNTIVLVHGYAYSETAKEKAAKGAGQVNDFWYWQGAYSDGKTTYDVPQDLTNAAQAAGAQVRIVPANWDGVSEIETSVQYLVNVLDEYCTGSNTCDLVGHSTGDALIGYALDKYQADHSWNINTVFVAGGAGGGTEVANWRDPRNPFKPSDPVVKQLVCTVMRALYNHDMHGLYQGVPNIRFVGAGTGYDYANGINYGVLAGVCRGASDGLVPFHSQGGVSNYVGNIERQEYDAYCIQKHKPGYYGCGQLHLGDTPAERIVPPSGPFGDWTYVPVPLFKGFYVAMIDDGRVYNHTDEVGRLAQWIVSYKAQAHGLYTFHEGAGNDGQLGYLVFDGTNWTEDRQIQPLGMSGSPSAVLWKSGITVFHQGSANNGELWYTYSSDGVNWGTDTLVPVPNLRISESPSAVGYNGLLYVFFQGGERLQRRALVRDFRWHKLARIRNSTSRYVGLTLGGTLEEWYYCLPPGEQ
jgi:hypothetical protein